MKSGLSMVLMLVLLLSMTSCKTTVNGCTDSSAINYNSKATQDDGSCQYGGQLIFWTNAPIGYAPGNADSVFINGTYVGSITNAYATAPACYSGGCYTYNGGAASYTWKNKYYQNFTLHTTTGTAAILANSCTPVKVY
jgi:hypothetical protein